MMLSRLVFTLVIFVSVYANENIRARNGDELVSSVLTNCVDMECVKGSVLGYLDNLLNIQSDARNIKNIDQAIFKRVARLIKTHEFKVHLPESIFDGSDLVYSTKRGLDITEPKDEGRGLLLKKKLLFPILLLLKLKMKALMPIFVALIGLKATKALILSKLALAIVLGFVIYQLVGKSGMPMPMPMSMTPMEPPMTPMSMYGPPSTPSSYEPGWEANSDGPYSRIWNSGQSQSSENSQSLPYSAYYPGPTSTTLP